MNGNERDYLSSYIKDLKIRSSSEASRLRQLNEYSSMQLRLTHSKDGKEYYYIYVPELHKYRYLGTVNNETVMRIKEAHYLERSVRELDREIKLIESLLESSKDISYEGINNLLNNAYKGSMASHLSNTNTLAMEWKSKMEQYKRTFEPFRPHELIHRTRDGTLVRSRGEALIYNHLLDLSVIFVYELPLRIRFDNRDSLILPDFTVLSEYDYKSVIYIEHQGMMDDNKYRRDFNNKVFKYWVNDYLPERDVFFTFDLSNGGFDDTPINGIIHRYIRP